MFTSITFIVLGLVGKCLLNWILVLLQNHICRSFLGVFSISLTLVDGAMTFILTTLHIFGDGYIVLSGYLLTRYHVCFLVQIVGEVQGVLQWPVVVMAALDNICSVTQRWRAATFKSKWILYAFVTVFLWCISILYTFLGSDFIPVMEDISHHQIHTCWVIYSLQTLHIALALLLLLGCSALCVKSPLTLHCFYLSPDQNQTHCQRSFVQRVLCIFFHSWTLLLFYLAVLFLVGIPSHLGLNVAWLCFLNSLLAAVVSCVYGRFCATLQPSSGLVAVPPHCFCEWKCSVTSF
ncbi:probable G-protein coupled receptor 160 [Cololabis saira]|uniref:probable G-protein coupled receptor 160 n=1 Tax=Cololabis saira TaxID=129043 RepID=UPI002AD58559|nr:probable G-protein coupled receptor 160 [Cololabis saira]XP_061587045.1 probable G-protein coupled receptor 160 [Cololabis saira]XP_061587046.1 probable G-protein coupled receptor 160 [Cololabis saira]